MLMDSQLKTAGNGRTPLTLAPDTSVQDIVRKTLTQEQSDTDVWSRDCDMTPVKKTSWLVFDSAEQASEEVGDWGQCMQYKLSGMKLRSLKHPAILPELPLESWWKPEYALESRLAKIPESEKQPGIRNWEAVGPYFRKEKEKAGSAGAAKGGAGAGGEVGSGAGAGAGADGGDEDGDSPPEAGLAPLKSMIGKLESGGLGGASSIDWETALSGDADGLADSALDSATVKQQTFYSYFEGKKTGRVDPNDIRNSNRGSRGILSHHDHDHEDDGGDAEGAAEGEGPARKERAASSESIEVSIAPKAGCEKLPVADIYPENVRSEEKVLDASVFFSKDFPLTSEQMVSIVGVMARTATHFKNVQRFFETKMPKDAGFPVKFQIPAFISVTATVTFSKCKLCTPEASLFEVPGDFEWGAYKERGMIRQL